MHTETVSQAKNRMLRLTEPVEKPVLKLVFNDEGKLDEAEETRLFQHIFTKLEAEAS